MLENNSIEMKTVVETFLIEETAELIYDNEKLEAWNKHVDELGLTGQMSIVKPDKSPIPFMHMKKSLFNIFTCLCPMKVNVKNYNLTPIPVEILNLVALSVKECYFNEIQVWYDDQKPDPAVIGYTKKWGEVNNYRYSSKEEAATALGKEIGNYNYQENYYLLGKWADVKHSFEELTEMAVNRWKYNNKTSLTKKIKESQSRMDNLDVTANEIFVSGTQSNNVNDWF